MSLWGNLSGLIKLRVSACLAGPDTNSQQISVIMDTLTSLLSLSKTGLFNKSLGDRAGVFINFTAPH